MASGPLQETVEKRDEEEAGKEDRDGRYRGSRRSPDQVADESRSREHGTRSDLAHGDRIEELRLRKPMKLIDEPGLQVRGEHEASSVNRRSNLQEEEEQRTERHTGRCHCWSCCQSLGGEQESCGPSRLNRLASEA